MLSLVTIALVVPSVVAFNTFTSSLEKEITDELKIVALNTMDKLSKLMFERVADPKFLTDPGNIAISGTKYPLDNSSIPLMRELIPPYSIFSPLSRGMYRTCCL